MPRAVFALVNTVSDCQGYSLVVIRRVRRTMPLTIFDGISSRISRPPVRRRTPLRFCICHNLVYRISYMNLFRELTAHRDIPPRQPQTNDRTGQVASDMAQTWLIYFPAIVAKVGLVGCRM